MIAGDCSNRMVKWRECSASLLTFLNHIGHEVNSKCFCFIKIPSQMSTIKQLPDSSVRLLKSTQIITSVASVVKELVENSLDAGATSVDIKLENNGFDKIEVRDNGSGIRSEDTPYMAKPNCTSKISSHSDLLSLCSYGFRGEALAALCEVANVTITTKTIEDEVAFAYILNKEGLITSKRPSSLECGTTVLATNLFKNVPVRRKFYDTPKKKKEELKKTEDVVMAFSVIHPGVRFALHHNRTLFWQKGALPSTRDCLIHVFGPNVVNQMKYVSSNLNTDKPSCEAYLPKSDCIQASRSQPDRTFLFVNQRPVHCKEIEKLVAKYYCQFRDERKPRYPTCFVSITVPPSEIDVNIEPNKTTVFFNGKEEVMNTVEHLLENVYGCMGKDEKSQKSSSEIVSVINKSKNNSSDVTEISALKHQLNVGNFKTSNVQETGRSKLSECDIFEVDVANNRTASKDGCFEKNNFINSSKTSQDYSGIASSLDDTIFISLNDCGKSAMQEQQAGKTNAVNNTFNGTNQILQENSSKPTVFENQRRTFEGIFNSNIVTKDVEIASEAKASDIQKNLLNDVDFQSKFFDLDDLPAMVTDIDNEANQNEPICLNENAQELDTDGMFKEDQCPMELDETVNMRGEWSRGNFRNHKGGKIENATIFVPENDKRCPDLPSELSPIKSPSKKKQKVGMQCQTTLFDMFSDKLVKRPMNAFYRFCQEKRSEVLSKFPNITEEALENILTKEWEQTSSNEKSGHIKVVERDKKRQEKLFVLAQSQTDRNGVKNGNINNKPSTSQCKSKKKYNPKEFPIKCDMESLKERLQQLDLLSQESNSADTSSVFQPIGSLRNYDLWMALHKNQIFAINHLRIKETVLFNRLLENHHFPMETLEMPIRIPKCSFSDAIWKIVLNLKSKKQFGFTHIVDERIVANGYDLRFMSVSPNDPEIEIARLATSLPLYGIPDLQEILKVIASQPAASLSNTRPLKAVLHLKKEAARIAKKSTAKMDEDELCELIKCVELNFTDPPAVCIHDKPMYDMVYDMNNIPISQMSFTQI